MTTRSHRSPSGNEETVTMTHPVEGNLLEIFLFIEETLWAGNIRFRQQTNRLYHKSGLKDIIGIESAIHVPDMNPQERWPGHFH
jgi:hypothetical protein